MEYFEQFINERNLKEETIKGYKSAVKHYTRYYNLSLDELIDEAIHEEVEGIDIRLRKIKTRIVQFRSHLLNDIDLRISTIKNHVKKICTIYKHFDVKIPQIPSLKEDKFNEITYFDLPTKEHIRMAVETSGLRVGSLILFMASSGTARTECANLTIGDFVDSVRDYYSLEEDYSLKELIDYLRAYDKPIVPTWYIYRQKTSKKYYTFCTPEATEMILEWLQLKIESNELKKKETLLTDKLWDLKPKKISNLFQNINDELEFGFKGASRFFRPHTIRKFHASNIGLSEDNIDLLQGRSRDSVHETYIKTNPKWLKELYMNVMENVTIGNTGKTEIKHEEYTININLNFFGDSFSMTF